MRLPFPLLPATFLDRPNRFLARVGLHGRTVRAHVPNPGRLAELLTPRRRVLVARQRGPLRRTDYDLLLVRARSDYVSIDSRLPPRLLEEAVLERRVRALGPVEAVRREVQQGASRFDLLLQGPGTPTLVEVKSCTLVVDGCARFPDAPTVRGARHCRHLAELARAGTPAAVVFVIQRADATRFAPNDATDPDFGAALREAAEAGVAVHAYGCSVSRRAIQVVRKVPVRL